jgi:hypothetical protein
MKDRKLIPFKAGRGDTGIRHKRQPGIHESMGSNRDRDGTTRPMLDTGGILASTRLSQQS